VSSDDERIIAGSGNVFRDLDRADADVLQIKAHLASRIAVVIERRGWTQKEAAVHLSVDQPRISHLLRGRLSSFSIDALLGYLMRLDVKVDLSFNDPTAGATQKSMTPATLDPEPRSTWSGAITFGMISIPVNLHPATQDKKVSFHLLHEADHGHIKLKPFCATENREVAPKELIRAYEVGEDQFVNITDHDLKQLPLPSQHTIELLEFVHAAEIDPIYFETSYYVEPEAIGVKPYALLLKVLERKAMVGIARIAIDEGERLCALRPHESTFLLHTMHRADEIRKPASYTPTVLVGDHEIALASTLVNMLEEPFDPSRYPDGYREA